MTPLGFLGVAAAGGLGAALRFYLDGLISHHTRLTFPLATVLINLTGSFLLGLTTSLVGTGLIPEHLATVLGAGLLGGYTTFSTTSVETVRLAEERRYLAAALNGAGTLVLCTLAAFVGLWVGPLV